MAIPVFTPSLNAIASPEYGRRSSPSLQESEINKNIRSKLDTKGPLSYLTPITNYTIDVFLQEWSHIVNGSTIITYVNHADIGLDEIYFHLYPNAFKPDGYLIVDKIEYHGAPLTYTFEGIGQRLLRVDLLSGSGPGVLNPGNNITFRIIWEVMIPESKDRFGWFHRTSPFEFLAYNLGNWHPIVCVYDERGWHTAPYTFMGESFYSDVATYDFTLSVPDDYIVAATGEVHDINSGAGRRKWHFTTGPVRDFTWCASPDYHTSSIFVDGVNVTSYFVAEHSVGGLRTLEVAQECLTIYGSLFGSYTWPSLRIVEADFWAGGMEYPQLVMIGQSLYESPDGISYLAVVTAHEIGHEWIPFSIGTDSYTEPWIDEGFASFCEYVWIEYVFGQSDRTEYRQNDLEHYWTFVANHGDVSVNQSMPFWESNPNRYRPFVYIKAKLVYDMFRLQLGNATFYQAWHYIYEQVLHQNIRTSTLQQLFEAAIGESLDWFFQQWVFGSGIVTLSLSNASYQQSLGGWLVSFNLHQNESAPIALWVPITITSRITTTSFWIWMNAEATTTHTLFVAQEPLLLLLDPNQYLLCQYLTSSIPLKLGLGILFPLLVAGGVGVAAIAGVIIFSWKKQQKQHSP
jgi:hypothetical protein